MVADNIEDWEKYQTDPDEGINCVKGMLAVLGFTALIALVVIAWMYL